MLIALGFLAATLLVLIVGPAFWARAVRVTTRRVKEAMPFTEAEIRADKDRIRVEYAIRVHSLEKQVEQVRLASARQTIDLNRRDASINELEAEIERLKATLEEAQNARRVLEQTVSDRLPRVEQRLSDARKLIFNRDREISELSKTADKQSRALAEAAAINAQQMSEIERLGTSLATRGARSQEGPSDARHDAEVALRSELESLRAKTRDQSQLIGRMQSQMARFGDVAAVAGNNGARAPALLDTSGRLSVASPGDGSDPAPEGTVAGPQWQDLERELRGLRARTEDQAGEIARLKASLAVFEAEGDNEPKLSLRESRIGLKARLGAFEAHNEQQKETIAKLRSEIAAANERLARQAAHFTSELKRLGAGTLPASGQPRRQVAQPRVTLAERVAQQRTASTAAGDGNGANTGGPNGATVGDHRGKAKVDAEAGTGPGEARSTATLPSGEAEVVAAQRRPRLLERLSGLAKTS
jgi:DNA repair exonuclease SbcCD ATPase subunit